MYFVLEITTTDTTSKGVYQYETLDEAVASFHSRLGAQMKNPACNAELVMVIDDNGAVYRSEKYSKPATA